MYKHPFQMFYGMEFVYGEIVLKQTFEEILYYNMTISVW